MLQEQIKNLRAIDVTRTTRGPCKGSYLAAAFQEQGSKAKQTKEAS